HSAVRRPPSDPSTTIVVEAASRNGPADGSTDAGAGITATSGCASGVRSHAAMTLHAATATARRPMLKARASLAAPKSLDSNEPGTVAFAHGADPEPRGVAQSL